MYRVTNKETRGFAEKILRALTRARWHVGDWPTPIIGDHFTLGGEPYSVEGVEGVIIFVNHAHGLGENEEKRLRYLEAAMGSLGGEVEDTTLPDNVFRIVVCPRDPDEGDQFAPVR
jgi:hypothetical protein